MKIKTGDKVLILHGKNRGKTGKVLSAIPQKGTLVVEGVNIQKQHVRPKKQGEKGQVIEKPGPVDVSNVKLVCTNCNKAARVGYKVEGGTKYRVCKKCNNAIK
ncbi:MAG: 50S ribosomal protein L24 [Candidatus Spechtbacterales bacterium]